MPIPASAFPAADEAHLRSHKRPVELILSELLADDLSDYVQGQWESFGPAVYDILEPPSLRLSPAERLANAVARNQRICHSPSTRMRKACLVDGTLVGAAIWYIPGCDEWINLQGRDGSAEAERGEGVWEGVDGEEWDEFHGQPKGSAIRREIMGDEPHWYLAPLWVIPTYQGCGVASALMREAVAWADGTSPPRSMYLESTPRGRAVYKTFGFELVEGVEGGVMVRKARLGS